MDSSFKTFKVIDSAIGDLTDELAFGVASGASSKTLQAFPCNSPSNSSITFSVQIPSESIVTGRDVLLQVPLTFSVLCGSQAVLANQVPVGQPAFKYGVDSSLAPFPMASLISTINCQINNTSVSMNLQDIFPQLLQMNSREHLAYYNGMTPSLPDGDYGVYSQALGAGNNPMAGFANGGYDNKVRGRGGFPVKLTVQHYIAGVFTDASLISTAVTDTWRITVQTIVTEPIFLSPFTWADPVHNAQGFLGINNMAFTLNIDSSMKRLFSSSSAYITGLETGTTSLVLGANALLFQAGQIGLTVQCNTPTLLFKFLSTQPSDLVKTKNVLPFTDFPRFLTTASGVVAPSASGTIITQSLQLNQMPSKIMLVVRKPMATQSWSDPATFLAIRSISVNLNNASGLLASASQNDLWRLSAKNGSNQTWDQFCGCATQVAPTYAGTGILDVATGGSLLVLDCAMDLSLPDYISDGSLGNYNLSVTVNFVNQSLQAFAPEVCLVCVNNGILTTVQGVSSTYTGILTKELVLSAKGMQALTSGDDQRLIGGLQLNATLVRHPRRCGGVASAGAMSAGVSSGGRFNKYM